MNYLKLIAAMSTSLLLFSVGCVQNTGLYYLSDAAKGTAVLDRKRR